MSLTDLLEQKHAVIAEKWLKLLFESYPPETSQFFKQEKDRFGNPVGSRLAQAIEGLFQAFLKGGEVEQLTALLDDIIVIRAVQKFAPSQALAFIFLLKTVIREELAQELQAEDLRAACLELESRIDGLALLGFDVYMQRREKLTEVRIDEVKRSVSAALRRAGIDLGTL